MNTEDKIHIPVLMEPFLAYFDEKKVKVFVDGTVGLGGHAEAILKAHPEIERFIGIDQDEHALCEAKSRLAPYGEKVTLMHGNYSDVKDLLKSEKILSIDGGLLDLGVSSLQLDDAERGFSFMRKGPLDMRMNRQQRQKASEVVSKFSEKKLGDIFRELGEERHWRQVARMIVLHRSEKQLQTTEELKKLLIPFLGGKYRRERIHPLTRVFQGLRIYVNQELEHLQKGAFEMPTLLNDGGICCMISFHSLEDRIVKNSFRDLARNGFVIRTKKPIIATDQEKIENRRSRSAKMRVIEKKLSREDI